MYREGSSNVWGRGGFKCMGGVLKCIGGVLKCMEMGNLNVWG